jgi:hypothetical protein
MMKTEEKEERFKYAMVLSLKMEVSHQKASNGKSMKGPLQLPEGTYLLQNVCSLFSMPNL